MRQRKELIQRILFFISILRVNSDPIDESRKWGNVTEKVNDR